MNRESGAGAEHEKSRVRQELEALGLETGSVYKFRKSDNEFVARLEVGILGGAEGVHLVLEDGKYMNLSSLDGFDITELTLEEEEQARGRIENSIQSDADDWYG